LLGAGNHGVELKTHFGKPAWVERQDPVAVASKGRVSAIDHGASLKAARGSLGKPHAPKAHARPHR
jgi:hypothetical protein